jgi:hypothetical protein
LKALKGTDNKTARLEGLTIQPASEKNGTGWEAEERRRMRDTKGERERERMMVERKRRKSSTICQMHVRCTDL